MIEQDGIGINLNPYIDVLREMGLFIQDIENNKAYPNKLWYELGYTADEMKNSGFLKFVHPDDLDKVKASLSIFKKNSNQTSRTIFRIKNKAGEWRWFISSCIGGNCSKDGKVLNYLGFDHDITAEIEVRKKAESLMKATEIISANLDFRNAVDAILEQAAEVFSLTSASVQLLDRGILRIVGSIGLDDELNQDSISFPVSPKVPNYSVITGREPYIVNTELLEKYPDFLDGSKSGIKSWMGIPLIYQDKLLGMMAFDHSEENHFSDTYIELASAFSNHVSIVIEHSRLFERVNKLAVRDGLTGCYNRRYFFESLQSECEKSKRYGNKLSLILFDIDDFKRINDIHGHLIGDQVLIEISNISEGCLRKTDILARYGGEEFVVLMPSTDLDEAFIVAERIRTSLACSNAMPVPVSISTGCTSFFVCDHDNFDNMLSRADQAMYESKAAGKNKTIIKTSC